MRQGFQLGLGLAVLLACGSANAQQGKPGAKPAAKPAPVAPLCEAPPPAVKDIASQPFYTDAKNSIADAVIVAKNKTALAALDKPLRSIVTWSNRWQDKRDAAAATCGLSWLAAWAGEGAMLGTMSSRQAEYDRKWRTAGVAIAYLKLKPQATPEQKAAIEPWLKALALKVEATDAITKARNNHMYWIGLSSTAVGVATGDAERVATGKRMFDAGMAAIDPDGALPEELGRGSLALHYHNYALAPLVLAAELAAQNGQDWYANAASLHRLAAFTHGGMANRDLIKTRAGATQKMPSGGILGWQAFYGRRFPGWIAGLDIKGPYDYSWLGGDLTALATAWVK